MKRLLLLFATLWTLFANGQSSVYRPFPTTYGNWIYRYYDDFGFPTSQQTQYTLNGDTIISSITYKKIFSGLYKGALRENSKRIYFIPDTSSNEYLLYDFNLTTGDTIIHPFGGSVCSNDTLIISFEDSILVSDGYHRQLHLSSSFPLAIWIEGIGSVGYLLEPAQDYCVSGNDRLECMISDTTFHYPSSWNSCVLTVSVQDKTETGISIFPNPSNGSFSIHFDKADIKEIIITDLLGNIVLQQRTDKQTEVKVSNLDSGTYFLTVIDNFGRQTNRKIISCP